MFLSNRQRISSTPLCDRDAFDARAAGNGDVWICRGAQEIAIETTLFGDLRLFFKRPARVRQYTELRYFPGVTQWNRNGIVGMTGRNECRDDELSFRRRWMSAFFCDRYLNQVTGLDAEPFRERGTHERGIIPGELRDWIRQFLKPAVIGIAAVVHCVTANQYNLWRICRGSRWKCPRALRERSCRG